MTPPMFLSYLLAVLAAASNATSNVLQRKANREEPDEVAMSPRLILDLLHRPVWLMGLLTVTASFLLMAAALGMGQLAAVQPIVVLELPLTLIGAAKVFHARLSLREWGAAAVMTIGLAGLIVFLSPAAGNQGRAPGLDWGIATAITVGGIAAAVGLSSTGGSGRRPALLGVATGVTFGLTAALMKGMTAGFRHGIVGVLTTWQLYAMVAGGLAGMFLMQNALHSGRLIAAQPGITLADPAVAILWGVFVFHETTRGGLFLVLAIVCGGLMATGAVLLARSPLLEGESVTDEAGDAGGGGSDTEEARDPGAGASDDDRHESRRSAS